MTRIQKIRRNLLRATDGVAVGHPAIQEIVEEIGKNTWTPFNLEWAGEAIATIRGAR